MKITERQVGEVAILDLAGDLTFEGASAFRNLVRESLTAGKTKLLINFAEVRYINSTGIGELVSAFTTIHNAGGSLKLMMLTKRVRDLLQITKLYTVFEVHDDEQFAVASFGVGTRYCHCPFCQSRMSPPRIAGTNWDKQTCPSCEARVNVGEVAGSTQEVEVIEVEVPTYEGEYLHAICDRPVTVSVVGRLNSFTSSTLDRLWSAIPSPKRVLFDLDERAEISGSGWTALMELARRANGTDRAAVSIKRLPEDLVRGVELEVCVHTERSSAAAALGDLGAMGPWLAKVEG